MGYAVVCGSLNMDFVCRGPRIPKPGETILGYSYRTFIGGKGGNQAVALAKLGMETHMIGCVGKDVYGDEIIQALSCQNVDMTYVNKVEVSTGTAHIMVEDSGENNIVVIPSANLKVSIKMLEEAENIIANASVLLAQLEISFETVTAFFKLGKKYDILNVLNPAPMPEGGLSDELLSLIDLITPNESEMKLLTGIEVSDMDSFKEAAILLHKKGVSQVICTVGSSGSYYRSDKQCFIQKAYKVEAVDTTCAGDSYNGALIACLQEGKDIKVAMDFASKVAALVVMREGAQESIPTRAEVDAYELTYS